jgi:hypothetical protein
MYSAKKDGKNRIHFEVIDPSMPTAEAHRPTDPQTSAAQPERERSGR